MEASFASRPARDCDSLAPGRVQVILDVALEASGPRGKKVRQQGIARTDLSHGRGESHLGRAAHSRGVENVRIRHFGANRTALDAESAEESRAGKSMGGFSEQSS